MKRFNWIHMFFLLIHILPSSSVGDRLGQLRTDGPQMLHGRSSNPIGGAGPQHNGDWLVQALPYLLHGGPNDGATHPPLVPDVPGEHHRALLWAILRLKKNMRFVGAIPLLSQPNPKTRFYIAWVSQVVPPLEQVGVKYLTQGHFDRSNHTWDWTTPLTGKWRYQLVGHFGTHWKCTVILLILYQTVSWDSREAHFFCCCNRPPLRLTGKRSSLQISLMRKQKPT